MANMAVRQCKIAELRASRSTWIQEPAAARERKALEEDLAMERLRHAGEQLVAEQDSKRRRLPAAAAKESEGRGGESCCCGAVSAEASYGRNAIPLNPVQGWVQWRLPCAQAGALDPWRA